MSAFFRDLGAGRYAATEHTTGPWTATTQHLGPPSALLVRAMELLPAANAMRIGRVTVEILGPVRVTDVEVRASVDRPGRSVELLAAELLVGGEPTVRARAWRFRTSETEQVDVYPALAPPDQGEPMYRPDGWGGGYLDIMEWRGLAGHFGKPGPATVWARQTVPLVEGETPTGLQRLLTVADSGNGASNRLDPREWLFINSELTVHVHREPAGEWIGLDATTAIGPDGIGSAFSVLHDEHGPVGRGAQALLIRPQRPPQ